MKRLIATIMLVCVAGAATIMTFWLGGPSGGEVLAAQQAVQTAAAGSESAAAMAETNPGVASEAEDSRLEDVASIEVDLPDRIGEVSKVDAGTRSASITLDQDEISVVGTGVEVDGQVMTIASAGTYAVSGELTDGRIVVNAGDSDTVTLVLEGAWIACSTFSPIYVANADEVVIWLKEGTDNHVEDGEVYILGQGVDEPNAAIFSHDDLTITGDGVLTVIGNYNNGIQSKDDLLIEGGNITVVAANDGLKGRNSITVRGGDITVEAGGDGLQSNNDVDPTKGTVFIESGTLVIEAGADGIQAKTTLTVEDGDLTLVTGGGSANSSTATAGNWGRWGSQGNSADGTDTPSAKGLKAGSSLVISGGTIEIDSSDDAIHSNDTLRIDGGRIVASSGDDGIHADTSLEINGGDITIVKSYEGIESMDISLNGGTLHVTASDDGINAAGGNDASALGGRPGRNTFNTSASCTLAIHGGYIYVDAAGDGLDINGPITMTDGIVIVNGPTSNRDGAIDYTGSFQLSGGYLVAAGSAGMAQAPSSSSSQDFVMLNLSSGIPAGTLVHIEDADGNSILTFRSAKGYQSLLLSSERLKTGTTYDVYAGGTSTGSDEDGLYTSGAYTPGTKLGSFTL
jgi:hypothetical protein